MNQFKIQIDHLKYKKIEQIFIPEYSDSVDHEAKFILIYLFMKNLVQDSTSNFTEILPKLTLLKISNVYKICLEALYVYIKTVDFNFDNFICEPKKKAKLTQLTIR